MRSNHLAQTGLRDVKLKVHTVIGGGYVGGDHQVALYTKERHSAVVGTGLP